MESDTEAASNARAQVAHDFQIGDTASFSKTVTEADIALFAGVSGDTSPIHLDEEYALRTRFGRRIAHGLLTASFVSTVLGTKLPGPGAIYVGQTLRFLKPVFIGDTITAIGTVDSYDRVRQRLKIATVCINQDGEQVLTGEAEILYEPPVLVCPSH